MDRSKVHVYAVDNSSTSGANSNDNNSDNDDSMYSDSEEEFEGQNCGPIFPSSHPCIPSRQFGSDNGAIVQIAILGITIICYVSYQGMWI